MKNNFALFGMGLAAILISSAATAQETPESKEAKKTRHIKMTKIENGKKMELDTVLTDDNVFVWNGDTLNPVEHIKKLNHQDFGKMHRIDMRNDSLQKKIITHKRMKDGNKEDHMVFMNGPDRNHFPPMPPVPPTPPLPHMKMMRMEHSGQIINLNDPNIISFKKKKMSGDREKIEIIRKKMDGPEHANFNFEFDDEAMAPEAIEHMREFEGETQNRKIIRKEMTVDDEKGKEIKVEIEVEENK